MNPIEPAVPGTESGSGQPKVSVITVVRNDRAGLARTIASVAEQRYSDLEFIVVNGASTDGTAELIRLNSDRISYWVSEPDKGLYDAMNKGIVAATGCFAIFVNAGDTFAASDSLCRVLSPAPRPGVVLYGNVLISYGTSYWKMPPRNRKGAVVLKSYLPHHQTVLYPRSFFETERYDMHYKVIGDTDYTYRAINGWPSEYRDVDIVHQTLGGLTFRVLSSLNGFRLMNSERQKIYRQYTSKYSRLRGAWLAATIFTKFICVRFGGIRLTTSLMQWKAGSRFLRSFSSSLLKRKSTARISPI